LILYKQLKALFARYIAAHLQAEGRPVSILGPTGKVVGAIDVLHVSSGSIRLAGWAFADDIVLHMNGIKVSTKADLPREDVARAHGAGKHVGFDFTSPLGPTHLHEINRFGAEFHHCRGAEAPIAKNLIFVRLWWAESRLLFSFFVSLILQLPAFLKWRISRDPSLRSQIKRGLGLCPIPRMRELDPDLFRPKAVPTTNTAITIILPVFNAYDVLKEALQRIVTNTDLQWRIILIEDCSTDKRVLPLLRDWSATHKDRTTFIQNPENLGFIKSVNKGLNCARRWPDTVVLLNSDALVPPKWASRLIQPLYHYPRAATATPMSNDAEIFSAPLICAPQNLGFGQGDIIDATAARLNPEAYTTAAPTGVGYCMAINPKYLKKVPQLDTSFGKGYGEEVDWCQKVRAAGGLHYCAINLFVEHRGGQSFGSAEKLRQILKNNALISKRYPLYDTDVQNFIKSDPLVSPRIALALAWIAAQNTYPVSIYFAHSMGGGAEAYLQHRIKSKHHALDRAAIVIRMGGKMKWQIELHCRDGIISSGTNNLDYIVELLRPLKQRKLVYSCAVGARDPLGVPRSILHLSQNGKYKLEFLFHDYFPISPAYTLTNENGIYIGLPKVDENAIVSDGVHVSIEQWQNEWARLLETSDEISVFSNNSRDIVCKAYPEHRSKIKVKPHKMLQPVPLIKRPEGQIRRVIGVLGDIGVQKGAMIISRSATSIEKLGIGLVIVGNFDPAIPLPPSARIHGSYSVSDLGKIAGQYDLTDWLVPSVWPETFSFTTHEALATGLNTHAFAIGAQGEAVAKAENGYAVPYFTENDLAKTLLSHIETHIVKRWALAS
jgi:GT2 family glycosyltransferase|tara:strand:+ start:1267 stop:3765 length:2499 start_codon:yes stop_codon:yes gene_type:complete